LTASTPSSSPAPTPSEGLLFPAPVDFENWLEANQAKAIAGTWILISKKSNTEPSICTLTYDQAVDAALCFGWIDGQRRSLPEPAANTTAHNISGSTHFAQRFTPRRSASIWSKRNVDKITAFLAQTPCPIRPAGLAQIQAAKDDGRWERAYAGPKDMLVPSDLEEAIRAKGGTAAVFFEGLTRSQRYPLLHKVETAKKPETRQKRILQIVQMLSEGKT
jgi:uncharacterized protein YdeI (YjbR/CyaY-like superfamily)